MCFILNALGRTVDLNYAINYELYSYETQNENTSIITTPFMIKSSIILKHNTTTQTHEKPKLFSFMSLQKRVNDKRFNLPDRKFLIFNRADNVNICFY